MAVPGSHTIQARAYDAAGNTTNSSVTVSVPVPPDTTAPTVSITSPADGATVSGSVPLAATASDNVGVTRVEFKVDGTLVGSDASVPYVGTWDASAASAGNHTVSATAYDAAGNVALSAVSVVAAAVSVPTVTITSPVVGATVSGSVALAATATDTGSGITQVEFRVDGVLLGADTTDPYGLAWDAGSASPGTHTIEVTAYNRLGYSADATVSVTIPSPDVPTVSMLSPGDGAVVSGPVGIAARASDASSGISKVDFRVDGTLIGSDTTYPYGRMWKTTGMAPGPHTVEAAAYNRAGRTARAVVRVNVPGVSVPSVSIVSPVNGSTVSGRVAISAIATDGGSGVARVDFRVDGSFIAKDSSSPYGCMWDANRAQPGTHVVEATAKNRVGRVSVSRVTVVVRPGGSVSALALQSPEATAAQPEDEEDGAWVFTELSFSASRSKTPARRAVVLRAKLSHELESAADSADVTLWREVGGTWTYLGVVHFNPVVGAHVATVAPTGTAKYWFYFGGDASRQPAGSNEVAVRAYPRIGKPTIRSSTGLRVNSRLNVAGRWYDQVPSVVTVVMYRKVNGAWKRYGSVRARIKKLAWRSGLYSANLRLPRAGVWRVLVRPDASPPADVCGTRTFRVR